MPWIYILMNFGDWPKGITVFCRFNMDRGFEFRSIMDVCSCFISCRVLFCLRRHQLSERINCFTVNLNCHMPRQVKRNNILAIYQLNILCLMTSSVGSFRILFLRPFLIGNLIWMWIRVSVVLKKLKMFWKTQHDYRCTSSVTGHPTFQLTCDGVPNWSSPWPMVWSWWSA